MRLLDDTMCFVCGPNNPMGLHLEFWEEGDRYHTRFTPQPHHTGYGGILHGGLLTAVLDEVMGRFLWAQGIRAATAQMEVRWRRSARIGEPLECVGWVEETRGRRIRCAAEARTASGDLVARASGAFMVMSEATLQAEEKAG